MATLRNNRYRNEHSEVDTGPLNDILFILLMFFLMISTLANPNVIKPKDLHQRTPFYVGSKKIVADSLEPALRKFINEGDSIKPAVVINADSVAQWGEIVRVMKIARKLGATTSATVTGNE